MLRVDFSDEDTLRDDKPSAFDNRYSTAIYVNCVLRVCTLLYTEGTYQSWYACICGARSRYDCIHLIVFMQGCLVERSAQY